LVLLVTYQRERDRDVEVAIGISLVVHVLLLLWIVWEWGPALAQRLMASPVLVEPEEEMVLLFPEQVMDLVEPEKKQEPTRYIRTTQNATADDAPREADFISDRNTVAASELPADPEGEKNMPTLDGIDPPRMELADRDYKDGELRDDGTMPIPPSPDGGAAVAAMAAAMVPKAIPVTPAGLDPVQVAQADLSQPLDLLMREKDESEDALMKVDRLPVEVRTAEPVQNPASVEPQLADSPPPPDQSPPDAAQPQQSVPAMLDPVSRTAGPQDAEAFTPFTRTSKARGTLSNRGEAAVNAEETPVGRYMKQVTGAVEKRWHLMRRRYADAVTFGNLRLRFYVNKDGSVDPPTILSDRAQADARMIDFTVRAILDAPIPPIPVELLPMLDRERLEVEYDVLIY